MFDVNDGTMEFATDGIYLVTGFVGGGEKLAYLQPYVNGQSQGVLYKGVTENSWHAGDTLSFVRLFIREGISFDNYTFAPRIVKKI